METSGSVNDMLVTARPLRKRWEAPCIVLERSLEVAAQGGGPADPPAPGGPSGFLGPLGGPPSLPCS